MSNFHEPGPQMADISMDNQRANFNTGLYETPSTRNKKIGLGQIFMRFGPQMADISVDNQRANFKIEP